MIFGIISLKKDKCTRVLSEKRKKKFRRYLLLVVVPYSNYFNSIINLVKTQRDYAAVGCIIIIICFCFTFVDHNGFFFIFWLYF